MYKISIFLLTISLIGLVSFFIPLFIDLLQDEIIDDLFNVKGVVCSVFGMCVSLVLIDQNE